MAQILIQRDEAMNCVQCDRPAGRRCAVCGKPVCNTCAKVLGVPERSARAADYPRAEVACSNECAVDAAYVNAED